MKGSGIKYVLRERKSAIGKYKGKTVLQAYPVRRDAVSVRRFCEEAAHDTTFSPGELEFALRQLAKTALRHLERGQGVSLGDLGHLFPTFDSSVVDPEEEKFNVQRHIRNPHVVFKPNKRYLVLKDMHYERVTMPAGGRKRKKQK